MLTNVELMQLKLIGVDVAADDLYKLRYLKLYNALVAAGYNPKYFKDSDKGEIGFGFKIGNCRIWPSHTHHNNYGVSRGNIYERSNYRDLQDIVNLLNELQR